MIFDNMGSISCFRVYRIAKYKSFGSDGLSNQNSAVLTSNRSNQQHWSERHRHVQMTVSCE